MADEKPNTSLMKSKNDERKVERRSWATLLPDLLKMVLSLLVVKDNIRASAVAKAWYLAGAFTRREKNHPWLVRCSLSSASRIPSQLYDPEQKKRYFIRYPEIKDMKIYYAKAGWLLIGKDRSPEMCFFNPFSRELISLPNCDDFNDSAIFTCAPTSSDCWIFGLANVGNNNHNNVGVNTYKLGDTKWESTTYPTDEYFFAYNNKIVFSGGLFFCLGGLGSLAIFEPTRRTWRSNKIQCGGEYITPFTTNWNGAYLLVIREDVVLLKLFGERLRVFKLNYDEFWRWEEEDRVEEGLTIFGGPLGAEYVSDLKSEDMKNKILLLDTHCKEIQSYYWDEGMYHLANPSDEYWDPMKIYQSVWVQPPKPKVSQQDLEDQHLI